MVPTLARLVVSQGRAFVWSAHKSPANAQEGEKLHSGQHCLLPSPGSPGEVSLDTTHFLKDIRGGHMPVGSAARGPALCWAEGASHKLWRGPCRELACPKVTRHRNSAGQELPLATGTAGLWPPNTTWGLKVAPTEAEAPGDVVEKEAACLCALGLWKQEKAGFPESETCW